ncbi:MAG: DNA gyrase/topoisomerase IV subunit A [Pseudobacteriovorax sp.]|nr:DNA gyrase/topoisomerase IV subunit A [Pseudobacteriovorax sp.]
MTISDPAVERAPLDGQNTPGGISGGGKGSDDVEGMYEEWFLDYASYVILDRAVPGIDDGLKPVQRRILHAMNELEDGRYNKAANIIGHTMRYHPHGDMAIEDALVKIAQKDLLIDTQGNWGNIATGDRAAAPRYIEARLSPFAKEILFKEEVTEWSLSYDGRNKEPVSLPVKFPLLLATGVEGIAVGLSTKILPHNFHELIDQSICHLNDENISLFPDFQTGGSIDVSQYNDGKRGGKVKVRANIEIVDNVTLKINELPYAVTTSGLIDSIISAADKGKLKIKKVEDNTAELVEVLVHLPAGISPHTMIDALYAFTDCEISISPNCCVVKDDQPSFIGVTDLLKHSVEQTKQLLSQELAIERDGLKQKIHFAELEIIFIEEKIYRKIETAESWDQVMVAIRKGLARCLDDKAASVSDDDITKLTEIKIKRISKFDRKKAESSLKKLKTAVRAIEKKLKHITQTTIDYYLNLKETYGEGKERKTTIEEFQQVEAKAVVVANQKLYVNRREGFVGTALKKDEFVTDCSDLDEIISFCKDGKFQVTKVSDKTFIGKQVLDVRIFTRGDKDTIYHVLYQDGKDGPIYAKRFPISSITRDRSYDLTKGAKGSRILHLSSNEFGANEVVELHLKDKKRSSLATMELDFSEIPIQTRGVKGQLISKDTFVKVKVLEREQPSGAEFELWFNKSERRLNQDGQGKSLGQFTSDDKLFAIYKKGVIEAYEPSTEIYLDDDLVHVAKLQGEEVVSCVYYHGEKQDYYVKRFSLAEMTLGKREEFVDPHPKSKILILSFGLEPEVQVTYKKGKKATPEPEIICLSDIVAPKGIRAIGNKLSRQSVKTVKLAKRN